MNRFSPEAASTLDRARSGGTPSADDRDRVRAALAARLGAPTLHAAPQAVCGALPAAKSRGWAKVLVRIVFAIAAGALLYPVSSEPDLTNVGSNVAEVSACLHVAPSTRPFITPIWPIWVESWEKPAVVSDSTSPAKPVRHAASPLGQPSPTGGGSVDDELEILLRAHSALKSENPGAALDALGEHARRFPAGVLAEERSSQRVVALCAAGRVAEARSEGERFLKEHPASPGAARVRATCALDPESTAR